jgi:ApeA N-terminal domain 1
MPAARQKPGAEVDCLVRQGDSSSVRGFLTLPGTDIPGELKLASDLPGSFDLEDVAPMRLVLQDAGAGTLACISDGFVVHHGISMPTPAAYPLRIHVNEVIIGADDPGTLAGEGFLDCKELLDFFRDPEIDPADAVAQNFVAKERLSLPFGECRAKVEEISRRDLGQSEVAVDFTGRLTLQGGQRGPHEWTDPLTQAIGFFSFCLDRPLGFDWIGCVGTDEPITLYASWRPRAAPINTVPLLREGSIDSHRLRTAASSWADLWRKAPHLMDYILAFQLRREALTVDGRLMVLVRTLELYHGYAPRFRSTLRSRSDNRELRNAILSALPPSAKSAESWLGDAINESNRKRLSMQLEEILDDLGSQITQASGISGSPSSFARSVAKTRNFFTHPKKDVPKGVPQGIELLEMVHRLWFVARACVLVELGLPRDFVAAALTESARRHYLVHGRGWATR